MLYQFMFYVNCLLSIDECSKLVFIDFGRPLKVFNFIVFV